MLSWLKETINTYLHNRGRCISIYPLKQYLHDFEIDCVLDVGANIGQTGLELRNLGYRGKICSFEPQSKAFAVLKNHAAQDGNWDVFPYGLGSENTIKTLNVSGMGPSSSFLELSQEALISTPDLKFVDSEQVETRRLDDILGQVAKGRKNIFVKIDTQGFELEVLKGAPESLKELCGLQMEISIIPQYSGEMVAEEMIALVRKMGFTPFWFIPGHRDFQTQQMFQMDLLAFRLGQRSASPS